jgi:hypothetical protein
VVVVGKRTSFGGGRWLQFERIFFIFCRLIQESQTRALPTLRKKSAFKNVLLALLNNFFAVLIKFFGTSPLAARQQKLKP